MIFITSAIGAIAITIAGRARWYSRSMNEPSPAPNSGNRPSFWANAQRNNRATTKLGALLPNTVMPTTVRSLVRPRRIAAQVPSGTPTITARIRANELSITVRAKRSLIESLTSSLVRNERPRSPCTTPLSQSQYWVTSGWSSPYFALRLATFSSLVGRPLSSAATAPPGISEASRNTASVMARAIGTSMSNRRPTYGPMPRPPISGPPRASRGDRTRRSSAPRRRAGRSAIAGRGPRRGRRRARL